VSIFEDDDCDCDDGEDDDSDVNDGDDDDDDNDDVTFLNKQSNGFSFPFSETYNPIYIYTFCNMLHFSTYCQIIYIVTRI